MTRNELQGQIEQTPEPVVVLIGPAGSGKTTTALDFHSSTVGEGCMLLAPNAPACDHLRRRLLDRSDTGALAAAPVNTFFRLAAGILAGGDPGRRI